MLGYRQNGAANIQDREFKRGVRPINLSTLTHEILKRLKKKQCMKLAIYKKIFGGKSRGFGMRPSKDWKRRYSPLGKKQGEKI